MQILDITGGKEQEGEVGIEIEVEGNSLPEKVAGWRIERDGSLRGESCEYVLRTPCGRDKVNFQLGKIEEAYKEHGTKVTETARQSIHIHINVQDMTMTQVYNFIILFLIFERPLVNFCGEHRKGNLFCLRSSDAEGLLSILEDAANPDKIRLLATDEIRYSAINVNALFKYGSLEFRSMRGTDDFKLIQGWIDILLKLKDEAMAYQNPPEIISEFSFHGVESFINRTLGDAAPLARKYEDDIVNSMRDVQPIVFNGDWVGLNSPIQEDAAQKVHDALLANHRDMLRGDDIIDHVKAAREFRIVLPQPDPVDIVGEDFDLDMDDDDEGIW